MINFHALLKYIEKKIDLTILHEKNGFLLRDLKF